jgi:hypothetical protein
MDEKYLQDIYNWITNKDASYKSDFSFDAFKTKMQDPAYSKKMHDWMGTVEPEQSKKKRLIEIQKPSTELPSEDGSLASQETKSKFTFDLNEFKQQRAVADATFIPKPIDRVEVQKKRAETVTLLNAQKIKDAQKKKEEESRIKANSLGIIKTPEFQQKLKIVDDKLIDKEEEEVVPKMNTEFGKYGFTFEESGAGDAMIVRSFDGKHTLKVDLDPFTNATEVAESGKLREFLNAYAQENFKIENEDFLSKASKAQNLRTAGRINPDGTESTVKMTSFEQDGKFFAIPTLFPKDPNSYNTSASTWQELPFEQALKVARERGELFQFNSDQEAKDFANGSWKDVSTRDIEADKWYKERGLDYITEKKRWDKYKELDDIIDFVEGNNEEARASLKKSNPELFIKGRIREDAKQYTEELKKQRDALEPLVKDYGFLSDGKSEVARMDWDVQLAKKEKQIAGEAIRINNDAKAMEYELDQQSIEKFGVPAKDLLKYKNIDPNTQVEFDKLQKEYYVVQQTQKEAATKFEIAKTYFDGKADKQVNGEFKENLRGFWNATTDAYNQGQIGQQLLSFTMPGGKDVSSFEDRKEAAEYIAKQYADMSNTEDRAMARWRNARGFTESFGVFFDDPAEMLATMVSSSLSQILPYGTKIVAASVAAGAGIGAAAGAPAGGVGAIPGSIAGAGYGLRTGMALTNLAAEYTNAVMAAVESKGYNPMDPESLAEALGNQEVWDEGKATGLTRGIPIAVVDFLTAGLAGRVFKPTNVLASTGRRVALGTAERIVLDPLAEGAGELAAQSAEIALGTGRKKIGWKEIAEESMGGLGSNTVNWGINSYKDIRNKNNVDIANTLTSISSISSERASDEKITSWANNMLQLKKIDEDVAQRINENVGLRREARELLEVGTEKKTNSESLNRTMELLAARNELSSTQNRREIYRSKIQAINEELAVIGETKKLLPIDKSVDLSSIIGTTRQGTSQYSIDGRRFTKEQFIEKVNALPDEQLNRVVLGINNDPETGKLIKSRYDAIQKSKTDAGVLRTEEPEVGLQQVGEGNKFEAAKGIKEATIENEKPKILSTVEETLGALNTLPTEEKTNYTFTNEKGEQVPLNTNEKVAAELFHQAIAVPEEERTASQQSAVDAIEVSLKTQIDEQKIEKQKTPVVNVAPFFDTQVTNKAEAASLRTTPEYQGFIKGLNDLAVSMGLTSQITDKIGGYKNNDGNDITEVSALVFLPGATIEQAEQFAALSAALTPDVQESSIAAKYTGMGEQNHNANEYEFRTDDVDGAIKALKEAGIKNFTADDQTGIITFTDVKEFADKELTDKIEKMLSLLNKRNIYYDTESIKYRPVESRFIDKDRRKDVLRQVGERRSDLGQGGGSLREAFERAVEKDAIFQGITAEEYRGSEQPSEPVAGNRLFNKPFKVNAPSELDNVLADKTNLTKAYNLLDSIDKGIDKFLKSGPNSVTTVIPLGAMKIIVKALKALVKGGMMLQDAIKKVAADNNVKEADIISSLTIINSTEANVPEGLSEGDLPGFDRMMEQVEGIVQKSKDRGVDEAKIKDNVMQYVMKSKVYETASDIQREKLVREVNKMFGVREKSAPSVGKLFGNIKDVTKITMTEKTALVKQIKDLARGARDAKTAISKASTVVTTAIKELSSSGTITAKQTANVLRRFDKTNLLSQESIDRFTQYMTKVFENAEYADNLKTAKAAKTEISSLSKNENKNANLRDLASEFIKIDPSLVKDIDAYNKIASEIKESLKGSNIIGKKVNFAEIVNIEKATEYIKDTMEAQKETILKFASDEIQDLMGVDPADFTYEEMLSLLQKDEPITKYNESIIRNLISKMFGINSSIIKSMIQTGEDAFTGDPVSFTKAQVDVINRFMNMSLDRLNAKEALQAVDALGNFIQNKSTAKMESVLADYQGKLNAELIAKYGIFAVPLKKLFSTGFGRLLAEQTTNLGPLFTRLFKGVQRGGLVEEYMGVTKLINSKAFAETQANNIANDYVKEFYGRKANGEKFNTERNNIERGMASFMLRNIIGTETEMQEEFDRRKKLIAESIDVLREGNELEQKKSNLYSEVFDKIVSESTNIQDVKDRTDAVNLEAVGFWIEQWSSKYDEMADVSLNVYNKVLDKDINYNPDKFFKLSRETGEVELTNNESAFHNNNGTIYKKESSGLMTAVKPKSLPKNTKNGQVSRYIDLAFDKNNANSMYDALVDIKTAAAIRQVESFLNSAAFNKIVSTPLDAKILKDRIQLYVSNIRNKNPYSSVDELSKTIRRLNKIAAIGVGQALGGITQPLKQVIPVAINTLINAGGLDLGAVFNSSKNNFISNSGYPIANRGVESQAQIESINKLIEQAAKSKGEQALKFIEKANKKWLSIFLVKPDVFIARASWLSYYEQSLKKQGISAKGIDYSSHTVNEQAANYAQRMVDRQQNISDTDQSGKLFADKNEIKQVVVKMIMPFASFRMNQATRLANDLSTIGYWSVSTTEDKVIAARSLAGFAVEMATFKVIGGGIAILLGTATKMMMGKEEDDEEKQKRIDNIIKGQLTGTVTDIFSPFPLFDKPIQGLTYYSLDKIQDMLETPEDSKFNIYDVKKEEFIRSLGLFGIALDRAKQLKDLVYLSQTGKFENDYGKDKWISEQDQSALAKLIGPAVLTNLGLAPSEVSSVIRMAISNAKKSSSTKEGGKTEEDIEMDDNKESELEVKKSEEQENRSEKIEVLEKLQKRTFNNKIKEEIEKQINILSMSEEDKKEYDKENKGLKELKKSEYKALLGIYDNQSDMEKYNKSLWEKTFGPNSSYYKENKIENEVEKMLRKELILKKDKEYNYRAPMKKKKW